MTVWSPSAPFPGDLAADGPAAAAGIASADAAAPAAAQSGGGAWRTVALAATVGALAALAVVLANRYLIPPPQAEVLKLEQVAHAAADLTEAQAALTQKLRVLETEGVATSEAVGKLDAGLQAERADAATMQAAIDKLATSAAEAAHNRLAVAALFGVAAVQLHDAVESGRPFDGALVNVRGIAPDAPRLLAALDQLAPLAAAGVPTQDQLAAGLGTLAQIERQRGPSPLVDTGLQLVGRMFGPDLLPAANPTPALLTRASAQLDTGDVAGSLRTLRGLAGPAALVARPLVAATERRAVALAAVQTLLDGARDGLRGQLKAAAGESGVLR